MKASLTQINELLSVLSDLNETGLIFTMPNSDTDSRVIYDAIETFVSNNENAHSFYFFESAKIS